MSDLECSACGKEMPDGAASCQECGAPVAATVAPPRYQDVPWYRRSWVNMVFILITLVTKSPLPLIVTCSLLLTGDIYYKRPDSSGNLRTWSKLQKVGAAIVLVAEFVILSIAVYSHYH